MEELDLKQEEGLYTAARDEAAELVWKHRNPNAPENNPDAPYVYPGLTRKGSHQRSQSLGRGDQDLQRTQSKLRKRNSMGSATSGSRSSSLQSHRAASGSSSVDGIAGFSTSPTKEEFKELKATDTSAPLAKASSAPSATAERRRSSGSRRKASGSLFKNPEDQIYEEPEEESPAPPPAVTNPPPPAKLPLQVRRNPFSRVQFAKDNYLVRANTDPVLGSKRLDRFEIHKNPPTQSRNAAYTANIPATKFKEEVKPDVKSDAENNPDVKLKDGKEIRSDDIRAATGFKLKDRSAKLPTPTVVSDRPGRPIVSFQKDFKPKEIELKQEISSLPPAVPKQISQVVESLGNTQVSSQCQPP
jgi:hypothetical protein